MAGRKKKNNNKVLVFIVIGLASIALGLCGALVISLFGPNTTYTNLSDYLGISADNEWAVMYNCEKGNNAVEAYGRLYLPLTDVTEKVSGRFYFDESLDVLSIVTPEERYTVGTEEGGLYRLGSVTYISSDIVEAYYPCSIKKSAENRMVSIWSDFSREYTKVTCTGDTVMRVMDGVRAEIVNDVKAGDELILLSESDKFYYCMDKVGFTGYIKKDYLSEGTAFVESYTGNRAFEFSQIKTDNIRLTWHMMDEYNQSGQVEELLSILQKESGLNVIAPTWYSVRKETGEFTDISNKDYVTRAHEAGVQVWGLVDNFSDELDNYRLLSDSSARKTLIDNLVENAVGNSLDGINVDFESRGGEKGLNTSSGPHLLQFLRELVYECHKNNLTVSVDIPVPYSYNSFWDRDELGRVVDYVIVMAYDEHYNGSEPGSVASPEFVTEGVNKTLEEISAGRVVLGVPFYTRQWTLDEKGNVIGSRERGEAELEKDLGERQITLIWLEELGQYYAEYTNEYGLVKVWLDDHRSLSWKMELVYKNNLAGAAAWRAGVETEEMWKVFMALSQ